MKRLRPPYGDDDVDSVGERGVSKDWVRRDQDPERSSSHRRFYSKAENGRKGLSSLSGYDRSIDDDREISRSLRKRLDHDSDSFKRTKNFDRYRDCGDRDISFSSPRNSYSGERIHRSESFSGSRRDFPKGFRSERDRLRREESVSSWRRFGGNKDVDEDARFNAESGRGNRVSSEERGNVRSPQGSKDVLKSSKEGGESSKIGDVKKNEEVKGESVDVKKNEEVQGESGSSSEMEEGELEPEAEAIPTPEAELEPQPRPQREEPETEAESKHETRPESESNQNAEITGGTSPENHKEWKSEPYVESEMDLEEEEKSSAEEKMGLNGEGVCDGKREYGTLETVTEVVKGMDEVPECKENTNKELGVNKVAIAADNVGGEEASAREDPDSAGPSHMPEDHGAEEATKDENSEKPLPLEEERKEGRGIDLEAEVENIDWLNSSREVAKETGTPKMTLNLIPDEPTQNSKDKGKSLAVSSSDEANSMEDGRWVETDTVARRDDAMEGPSCRGFELFSIPAATRQEKANNSGVNKHKAEMLKLEPLELSLGLPNVSLALDSHDLKSAPGSPSHIRSALSVPSTFWTGSAGFTASISFSGSQSFAHNPSCSLTQNSFDNYEHSVGSHPIFQGVDQISNGSWQGQSSNEPKRKDVPLYQRSLLNGNAFHSSQGILNQQTMQVQNHLKISEGTPGGPVALDRQSSLPRQLPCVPPRNQDEIRSSAHSVGSQARSEYRKDKKRVMREKSSGSLLRSSSQREIEQLVVGGTGFVERIIAMIISEPVQVMARRIHEMTEQSIAYLKEGAREMIVNGNRHGQLCAFQEALQSRSDLTLDMLTKSHRAQLEILVALKTGLQDILYQAEDIPDLAEIFLNLKCRNLACKSPLPVDDCDCKVCALKTGFCSACMCLVCSKFDMASETCSWVGCDLCLHWCHTSCGLQESYIRNGHSVTGAQGTTEMQFHCVACDHPSEMFGFVKEVFKTCAKKWEAEIFSKELEYVKRIFSGSNDMRGKQLHDVAEKMQARIENNKSNLPDVYNQMMEFLSDSDFKFGNTTTTSSGKEQSHRNPEVSIGVLGPSQEAMWLTPVSTEKATSRLENGSSGGPNLDWDRVGHRNEDLQLHQSAEKRPVMDELESIVRIKQVEAKMFQERADDARREAEGLKRIAIAKNEKIEEEYASRITKLCLAEAEERRRQKLEELQILERAHREYFNMKTRMEAEIRDLLLKMETVKRNLST
ncbi:hypothetical protein NE237_002830 [Protea cynaroides]|uniref:Protein OBERON 4 n=1 Tax=Protea cynaroides TaxID=273540 RepID=A0A9Q0KFW9_9MAGN|nr:hypothetical protein NE237_002830 [Protea cynaroides]